MSFNEKIIFLLSTPRSGSSLTTAILNNHPEVFAAPESWFLMKLNDLNQFMRNKYGGEKLFNNFFNGIVPQSLQNEGMRAFINTVYKGLCDLNDTRYFLDKSPRYFTVLELIDRLYPASKRIWLVRNPLSVVTSYKMLDEKRGDEFNEHFFKLKKFNMRTFDITYGFFRYFDYFQNTSPEHMHRLVYEQLTTNPREEVEKLCAFLDISYLEGLEKYGEDTEQAKKQLLLASHTGDPYVWKHKEPHQDSIDLWKSKLTVKEIDAFMQIMGTQLFTDMGYADVATEAQQMTGKTYQAEPDREYLQTIHDMWLKEYPQEIPLGYQMQVAPRQTRADVTEVPTPAAVAITTSANPDDDANASVQSTLSTEIAQLKLALTASETKRKRTSEEMNRYKSKLQQWESSRNLIPFYPLIRAIYYKLKGKPKHEPHNKLMD